MAILTADQLKQRLQELNSFWDPQQYRNLLDFYVLVLPRIFSCERCGIFIVDPDSHEIISAAGTNIQEGELKVSLNDSLAGKVVLTERPLLDNELRNPSGGQRYAKQKTGYQVNNILSVPLFGGSSQQVIGTVQLTNKEPDGFTLEDSQLLQQAAHFIAVALETLQLGKELISINNELESQIEQLRTTLPNNLIAESAGMRDVISQVTSIGPLPLGVMITGENGTGKEQIAKLIHQHSPRVKEPFVAINCAAIPDNLVESELFGYEKGAFTGASQAHAGKFEQASGGTLFLDEIGELPIQVQPKLLRAIQEQEGQRLGSTKTSKYDLRIVCATNRDLNQAIEEGTFREDLYYRLFSIHLHLPPLRERPEDIVAMSQSFLRDISQQFGKQTKGFSRDLVRLFESYSWPGNVRQLRREMERLVALTPDGEMLSCHHCSPELQKESSDCDSSDADNSQISGTLPEQVEQLEIRLIKQVLVEVKGNKQQAAKQLGLSRPGLYKKLQRYGLDERF